MFLMPRRQPWQKRGAKPIANLFQGKDISKFISCEIATGLPPIREIRGHRPRLMGNHRPVALDQREVAEPSFSRGLNKTKRQKKARQGRAFLEFLVRRAQ